MENERYYPVMLNLTMVKCLVVGGGTVAEWKIMKLLQAGARVSVVSPMVTPGLQQLLYNGKIHWIKNYYKAEYLQGMKLVICATGDTIVNETVFNDANNANLFVNVVDDPHRCSFIVPAIFQKGDLQVAVSSGGAAPAISAKLRDIIEKSVSDNLIDTLAILKQMRSSVKTLPLDQKQQFWKRVEAYIDSGFQPVAPSRELFNTMLYSVMEGESD